MGGSNDCLLHGDLDALRVEVDLDAPRPRPLLWSVGYWTWAPSYGDPIEGTEDQMAALAPQLIRVGGYNVDTNLPDPFDDTELEEAVAYARVTGAKLLWQLPLLALADGSRPTPSALAEMVHSANGTRGLGIRYVSVGNEPDIYPDQGGIDDPSQPAIPGYDPGQYCDEMRPLIGAIREADPSLEIVGPDLAYKYQPGFDWLTPILTECGDLFDVIAIHRYPFESLEPTPDDIRNDIGQFRQLITTVRGILDATGQAEKPLALSEANLGYIASPTGNPGGSVLGTIEHALWLADLLGAAADLGLWTASIYDIADPDEFQLGLIGLPPQRVLRPAYHAIALAATPAGTTSFSVTTSRSHLRAYATRHRSQPATHLALVHWDQNPNSAWIRIAHGPNLSTSVAVSLAPRSITSLLVSDEGSFELFSYSEEQANTGVGPRAAEVLCSD